MPVSRSRKKRNDDTVEPVAQKPQRIGNPAWLVPTMVTLLIVGCLWVVLYYLTASNLGLPLPWIGQWNIAVGFVIMLGGLGLATRWR
ncbi:cell division protein CrgA [Jonesia quinghaiensis]|uniref:cell division protein CrgA n=1 Tax=Jonesia quinghaiensis TaxID=262806 RepID=UPI000422A690|nr:cell division protein CrgA [Jonesia quinghaiensis]